MCLKQNHRNSCLCLPLIPSSVLPLLHHFGDITVYACVCVYLGVCWYVCVPVEDKRGILVSRPQIYEALTLAEESTFSSLARNTDKRNFFTPSSHSS